MTEDLWLKHRDRILNYCFMNDIFFSVCFDRNVECVQYVLQIILDKSDLIVKSATSQCTMENFFGRDVRLDVLAEDSAGKLYNIEVQRKDDGAIPQRARYNSSMLDTENLEKGAKFKALPEVFVIFITEHDVLKGGEQIYHIERVIKETGKNFGDGSHIIYVNGSIRSGSRLGDLMHDFFCKDPSQMKSETLATRADFVKHSRKAVYEMSEVMERIAERIAAEREAKARAEVLLENIRALMERLHWTAEVAMDNLGISPEKQKELAPLI